MPLPAPAAAAAPLPMMAAGEREHQKSGGCTKRSYIWQTQAKQQPATAAQQGRWQVRKWNTIQYGIQGCIL